MALARSGTGFAAFFELTAGRGAPFVNAAARLLANAAPQRGAARWAVVGAAHAASVVGDRVGQARRHSTAAVLVLVDREIDPKARAAGAAGGAGGHARWRSSGLHAAEQQEFHERYQNTSGLVIDPVRLQWYSVLNCYQALVSTLGSCYRVVRMGKNHQDALMVALKAEAAMASARLQEMLMEIL